MDYKQIISWLLEGDVSVQYQVHLDLLSEKRPDLQQRISTEGFGAQFLSERLENGHWGQKFYFPKWTSTHYTLVDLRNLCISPEFPEIQETINMVSENEIAADGGILPIGVNRYSDLCINGMFLNYASYFKIDEHRLKNVVDCILSQVMPDGGFNCRSNRYPCVHSSLHTTISVLEGIIEFEKNKYVYRISELLEAKRSAIEFILMHQLYISDRTGETISDGFLKLAYPTRWKYDILRAMDCFQYANVKWDERMRPAINILLKKRNKLGTWNLPSKHAGQVHFDMEKAGKPSRWNTLRVLRVLKHFEINF